MGAGCASSSTGQKQRIAVPANDWKPAARWRGFNLLGMFRCPTIGLKPDPRVDEHFVEWEFQALRDWGFNFARLPLDYRILIGEDNWLELDEREMMHLDNALDRFINHEWKTSLDVVAKDGKVAFRGFKGRYRLTWTDADGKQRSKYLVLGMMNDSLSSKGM